MNNIELVIFICVLIQQKESTIPIEEQLFRQSIIVMESEIMSISYCAANSEYDIYEHIPSLFSSYFNSFSSWLLAFYNLEGMLIDQIVAYQQQGYPV